MQALPALLGDSLNALRRAMLGRGQGAGEENPQPSPLTDEERDAKLRELVLQHYRPGQAEQQRVALVEKRYDAAKQAKEGFLRTWATAYSFFVGEQYREWNPSTNQMILNQDVPSWRVRLTDNQVTTLANTIAAKRAKSRHITSGIPNNPQDPEDRHAARLATKLLRHLERITERNKKRLYLELLSTIYGTAFILPYWDKTKRTSVAFEQPNPRAALDPEAPRTLIRGEEVFLGDLDFEVLDVWQVFPQPATWWERVEWCVVARTRTLEWVRMTFGELGYVVSPDNQTEADMFATLERNATSPAPVPGMGQPEGTVAGEDSVRVLEYYEKASVKYPEGRYIIVANGVLLHYEEQLPHPKRRFPILPYFGIFVPGRLWGKGWVEDLVGQQKELNRTESAIIENKNLCGRPKWAVDIRANVDENALDGNPGEVVEYDGGKGSPPAAITPPSLPSYVAGMPDQIIDRMRNIAGVHEVTTGGSVPGGVSSGVAIDLLQQQDESRLSIPNSFAGETFRELDQQFLEYAQAFYTVPRLIRTFGKDQEEEALSFMGTDLRGNTEVGLEPTEGVSDSVAALRQRILDYQASGLFNSPLEFQLEVFTIAGETQLAEMVERLIEEQAQALAAREQVVAQKEQELQKLGIPLGGAPAEGMPAGGTPAEGVPAEGAPAEGAADGMPVEGEMDPEMAEALLMAGQMEQGAPLVAEGMPVA